jgi:response regulator RpfG family c-di-GMP phosphodiesterase
MSDMPKTKAAGLGQLKDATILVVEDNLFTRTTVTDFLVERGARVDEAENAPEALELIGSRNYDLIISDIIMPEMNGIELLRTIRQRDPGQEVIMITASSDINYSIEAIRLKVYDYIIKPIDFAELSESVANALSRALSHREHEELEHQVAAKEQQIQSLFFDAVQSLINALEARDAYTKGHSQRVKHYTELVLQELDMDEEYATSLLLAAQLHDIGKLGMSDFILYKAKQLSTDEREVTMKHPEVGYKILQPILPQFALDAVRHHHERWDGSGYPGNLKGEEVPLGARIISLADSYDAMTSQRIYREIASVDEALNEVHLCSGSQFDPALAESFIKSIRSNY